MKFALVVGHRKKSQGAVGSDNLSEYKYYKNIFIPDVMNMLKVESKMFTRGDYGTSYTDRIRKLHKKIDDWGADYAISFHFDASSNPKAQGHTVLYDSASNKSKATALVFDSFLDKYMHNRDRGLLDRHRGNGSAFLRYGNSTNVLLELYFASHQHLYAKGTKGYDNAIKAVVDAIHSLDNKDDVRFYFGKRSLKRLNATGNKAYIDTMKRAIKISKVDITIKKDGSFAPYPKGADWAEVSRAVMKSIK